MTLVVAERRQDQIRIWADSALRKDLDTRKSYSAMGLKVFVLHRGLCVAFAGAAEDATTAILGLNVDPQTGFDADDVVARLHSAHEENVGRSDFLIGSMTPTPILTRISGGEVLSVQHATHIGEPSAYSAYRQRYESIGRSDPMLDAMESVIDDEKISEVGGVPIGVDSAPFGFTYRTGWATLAASHSTTISPDAVPGKLYLMPIAKTAAEGGYRNVFAVPAEPGICAFAIYFQPGDFGYLLNPRADIYPIQITNVTQDEFAQQVEDRYEIELIFHGQLHSDW